MDNVDVDAAVPLLNWVSGEASADGRARRRAIDQIEAPIVLWALDYLSLYKAAREVSVAVGA